MPRLQVEISEKANRIIERYIKKNPVKGKAVEAMILFAKEHGFTFEPKKN